MIKAEELRIGNWVQCDLLDDGNKSLLQVRSINRFGIHCVGHEGVFGGLEGVPLAPEILEACGAVYHEDLKVWRLSWGKNGFLFLKLHPGYNKFAMEFGKGFFKVLDYLHQLQNLFFAHTETELAYTPVTEKA